MITTPSPSLRRTLGLLLFSVVLLFAFSAPTQAQDEDDGDDIERVHRCVCKHRRACSHYLNAPEKAPNDVCACAKCENGKRHGGGAAVPEGWNPDCFRSGRMDCYLKRHAESWNINCNQCLAKSKCCKYPDPHNCPRCGDGDGKDPFEKDCFRKPAREAMAEQMEIEGKYFKKKKFTLAYSRYAYVVTDVPRVRIQQEGGGVRWVSQHEYAHITIERAEKLLMEFKKTIGGPRLSRPVGIYIPKGESTARKLQEVYFRNRKNHMIYAAYAGRSESSISDGFCLNGFCIPIERLKASASGSRDGGGDDFAVHSAIRHLMGHIMFTTYAGVSGENRKMPRWAFVGGAHWLGKRFERHRDNFYYCVGESNSISGSGGGWERALKKRAQTNNFLPIEELLAKSSLGQLGYKDHVQAWGYFHYAMQEHEEGWVAMLRDLRKEVEVRSAFETRLGMSPEVFHGRFLEFLLGKREGTTSRSEEVDESDALARLLEQGLDPEELAARLRALGIPDTPKVVKAVLDILGSTKSELVRETAFWVLKKTTGDDARAAIHTHGVGHAQRFTRAYAARLCRYLKLKDGKDALAKQMSDPFWLARSEAALASAAIQNFNAQSALRDMAAKDTSDRARIGAMDALVLIGEDVNQAAVVPVASNLSDGSWQVRLAAAQCLGGMGHYQAVDHILLRLEKESGRIQEALFEALRDLSGEDFGPDLERWKAWWRLESRHVTDRGGFVTPPKPPPTTPGRYAPEDSPTYYGEKIFSQAITYVVDTSRSTNRNFTPSRRTKERLLGEYEEDKVLTVNRICQIEVEASVKQLDPRAKINMIVFGTLVREWQKNLVPASGSNKNGAASFARSAGPAGETNFYGALTLALDLDDHPLTSPNVGRNADTVTFLTDGAPHRRRAHGPGNRARLVR